MNIGRTRSNAISGPDQRPSMQHVSKLPEPVQEKTLEERQAIFKRQLKTQPGVSLHSPQVSGAVDQMIDAAQPQDLARQDAALAKTGVSLATATQEDEDWVVLEDKWVDKVTTQDSEDGVIVGTVLDDAVSTITEQAQTIHGKLSLSSSSSTGLDLDTLGSRYQDIVKEFEKLDADELTESRMNAFESLKTSYAELKADAATGQRFHQQHASLQQTLDSVWAQGALSPA